MIEKDTWYRCTICGRKGTVGRCCGDETREPLNELATKEQVKIKESQKTAQNSDYAKLPTIEECYQAIPFPSDEHDCAMFVAGIAECHKFVSRHFAERCVKLLELK